MDKCCFWCQKRPATRVDANGVPFCEQCLERPELRGVETVPLYRMEREKKK